MHARASRRVTSLHESLLGVDAADELPRVVFVNMAWVLHQQPVGVLAVGSALLSAEESADAEDARNVRDHQFALIKHANNRYQVVQGYMGSVAGNHSNRNGTRAGPASAGAPPDATGGYCLSSWQNQPPAEASDLHGGRYASRHGFSQTEMACFLHGLGSFAAGATFDAASYKTLFGVYHPESAGRAVWPSLAWRELRDEGIVGSGERYAAEKFEGYRRLNAMAGGRRGPRARAVARPRGGRRGRGC